MKAPHILRIHIPRTKPSRLELHHLSADLWPANLLSKHCLMIQVLALPRTRICTQIHAVKQTAALQKERGRGLD